MAKYKYRLLVFKKIYLKLKKKKRLFAIEYDKRRFTIIGLVYNIKQMHQNADNMKSYQNWYCVVYINWNTGKIKLKWSFHLYLLDHWLLQSFYFLITFITIVLLFIYFLVLFFLMLLNWKGTFWDADFFFVFFSFQISSCFLPFAPLHHYLSPSFH